jgi:wingless-type MMTV integration site family protein 8
MAECAHQFKNSAWDCPMADFKAEASNKATTKERAFVNAILSAGVVHTVARNCSSGQLADCGCEHNGVVDSAESWQWGGCSDNVVYGAKISRHFLDDVTSSSADSKMAAAIKHNNQAGRVAVKKTMRRVCKCHGVSGSCATQTCWRQVGGFRETGNYLKKQYTKAMQVDYRNENLVKLSDSSINSNKVDSNIRGRRTSNKKNKEDNIKKRKLVFLESSPDYCQVNPLLGYTGVTGRKCIVDENNKEESMAACTDLCTSCGLKAKKEVVHISTTCNCKFEWCCNITCDKCSKEQIIITCEDPALRYNSNSILSNAT